jgi:hypothetical protein
MVYRMAPVDPERARRLALAVEDRCERGYALGMMALGLVEAGKESAAELLENAFESLERAAEITDPKARSFYDPGPVAAALLPIAERINPERVDEYLWRAMAMRLPVLWDTQPANRAAYVDVQLAIMLARYDRALARSLIEPLTRDTGGRAAFFSGRGELYAAAAVIDPNWAVSLVEAMADDTDLRANSRKNRARLAVAEILGRTGEIRWKKVQSEYLYLWVPDTEDNDPYL